jgi:hypothetical protein
MGSEGCITPPEQIRREVEELLDRWRYGGII